MLIYTGTGFHWDGWTYKCDRCGYCAQEWEIIVKWHIHNGRYFEWLKCAKCGFNGNLTLNK